MIKVIRCRNSHEPTIQKTINIYIHLFRKGKDHTITETLSVPPEHQKSFSGLGKLSVWICLEQQQNPAGISLLESALGSRAPLVLVSQFIRITWKMCT